MEVPTDPKPKKFVLAFKPNTLLSNSQLMHDDGSKRDGSESPQATDDFLTIIPKPTLLSKERAKKRLQAFSSQKLSSPVAIKKPVVKKVLEIKEEKFDDEQVLTVEENNVLRKPLIFDDRFELKTKNTIYQIGDDLRKQQDDKLEAPVQVQRHPISHSQMKHRRAKREKMHKYHGRSQPRERKNSNRYPICWDDFRDGKCCLSEIRKMNELSEMCTKDFVKTSNFEVPNMTLRQFKYRRVSGKKKLSIPLQYVRFTLTAPRVPYSVNLRHMPQPVFCTVKQVQEMMPKRQRESIKSFMKRLGDAKESHHQHHHHQHRHWYSKDVLPNLVHVKNEMESSSRRDEDFKQFSNRSKSKSEERHRHYKQHKFEEIGKRYEGESFRNLDEVKMETAAAANDPYEMHYHHRHDYQDSYIQEHVKSKHEETRPEIMNFYNSKYKEDVDSFKTKEGVHHFANAESEETDKFKTEILVNNFIDTIALPPDKNTSSSEKLVSSSTSELCKEEEEEEISLPLVGDGKEQIHEVESSKTEQVKENSNGDEPNTDEYRSHWESEGEGETEIMAQSNKANNCWESDEEDKIFPPPRYECIPRTKDVSERSLEMPLNINLSRSKPLQKKFNLFEDIETKRSGLFMDEAWEKPKARAADLEYEALEKERRTLDEERKKLEIEKQKIAEMGRRILNQLDDSKDEFRGVVTKSNASYINKKLKTTRWGDNPLKVVSEEIAKGKEDLLEDEYEQFMKAVAVEERIVSSSNNSSDVSDSSSESSAENAAVPVGSPPSVTSTNISSIDTTGIDLDNRKPLTSIVLNRKTNILDRSVFKESEDEEEAEEDDAEMEEKESSPKRRKVSASPCRVVEEREKASKAPPKRSDCIKKKEHSPHRRHSPVSRREHSPRRREYSPKRRAHSPVRGSKRGRYSSPSRYSPPSSRKRRDLSPRRKHSPPRRRHSPPSRSRRDSSPPSYRRRYSRSSSKEPSKTETIQQTLQRLAGMDQYEPVSKSSPVNSPLDGFKRSLADSTISDEQLLQNQEQPYMEQQYYEPVKTESGIIGSGSPKRIPLDDRINQVLGIDDKDEHKPIITTYASRQQQAQHYESYNSYNYCYNDQFNNVDYEQKAYEHQNLRYMTSKNHPDPTTKVVQVGNVLQVVPTDNSLPPMHKQHHHLHHHHHQQQQQQQPKEGVKTAQRIVQVGNMLQIVPTTTTTTELPLPVETPRETLLATVAAAAATAPLSLPPPILQHKQSAEDLMQLKIAERKAEREKRRLEREKRRKEKERKRIEREKRKQLKIKQKTEEMIKKALSIETPVTLNDDEEEPQMQWPPVSSLLASSSKTTGKGILIRGKETEEYSERPKKGVKFADGIIPGEGTSPSGGEELSSPPPIVERSKEKRFTKTKKPKIRHPKKKIKVQIVRKRKRESDEEDEDGLPLPPPSPPPGSPPPHLFPPRIKPTPNFSVLPPMGLIFNSQQPPPMPEALQPQNYPPTLSSPLLRQPPKQLNHSIKPLPQQVQPPGLSSSHHG
ncbi:PREDICTED: uncharacterized protein LOC108558539 isoform X2 [Nicrophorus vespilloides]|nr:PREDICTED: uncharacterized protein LOC108558539 isoform X2 [Nicrophorus vespilloides]